MTIQQSLDWLANAGGDSKEIYNEVIAGNSYGITEDVCREREFIDIGANVGMFSIFASKLGAKKVIAVEPVSSTVDALKNNLEKAHVHNVDVKQKIVSSKPNKIFKIGLQKKSGHSSVYCQSESYEEVESITLKDLLSETTTDNVFLKIDCEGGEYDIILNADPSDMARISTVAIEIHGDLHPTLKGVWHVHRALFELGYTPQKQNTVMAWDYDSNGRPFNMRVLPTTEEIWVRS